MYELTVLLVCSDADLMETIRSIVEGVDRLSLSVVGSVDEAYTFDGWEHVAFVLIHHDRVGTTNGVARLLRMIAAARRPVATVVLAESLDAEESAGLLRLGLADLLTRPYDFDRLAYLTTVLSLHARKPSVTLGLTGRQDSLSATEADPMTSLARRVASLDTTVLIEGEAGTGKSRLARMIHDLSPRRSGPFTTIRCDATEPEHFDDELERLSQGDSIGGTLVLDDVDALAPRSQAALLLWIENRSADNSTAKARHPRLIATSRSPIADEVAAGRFRSDLFYRLNVIGMAIAPLRQRPEELGMLASEILKEIDGRAHSMTPEAVQAIESHPWPGNIRDLREALSVAIESAQGPLIRREDLPTSLRTTGARPRPLASDQALEVPATTTLAQTKSDAEYVRITEALNKHGHNRLRTASELGISRMTLYKKLYKYGIIEQEGRDGWFPGGRNRRASAPKPEVPPGARIR